MKPLRTGGALLLFLLPTMAHAHEPLWGESPQTFAFGVWHPEVRFGFENASQLLSGGRRLANPDALRRSRFEAQLGVQYAPTTSLNVKLEIPVATVWNQQRINGQLRRNSITGLGNAVFSAKTRFYQRFGPDWKIHQSFSVGLQLPTGEHNGRLPDGSLLGTSFQPGSGKWGVQLGYAFAWERLQDTTWMSAMYVHDFGGSGSRGDFFQLDANYGYWVVRAKRPQDFGSVLAAGLHFEQMGRDRLALGTDPDSGYSMLGLQGSWIVTKGQTQFRAGILVPISQHINGVQLRPEVQFRMGLEILL
jgi:hypothetical protein